MKHIANATRSRRGTTAATDDDGTFTNRRMTASSRLIRPSEVDSRRRAHPDGGGAVNPLQGVCKLLRLRSGVDRFELALQIQHLALPSSPRDDQHDAGRGD